MPGTPSRSNARRIARATMVLCITAFAATATRGADQAKPPAPGELLRKLMAQMDSGQVDSSRFHTPAYVDTIGPRRMVYFTRQDLALPAIALQAAVDSAVRAGATDILVDVWTRATVPYIGSAIARTDSSVAGADPLTTIARAASDAHVRAWLYLSGGVNVWESPLDQPDPGPFIKSHGGMASVNKYGKPGYADSTAGVWRYSMSPSQIDVHRFLFNVLREAMARYPVYGVALDGIEFASDDFSFDKTSMDAFITVEGVDPRNMEKSDLQYIDWAHWRTEQMRVFPSSLYRAMRRTFPDCSIGWFVRPSSTREKYLQEWPLAVNRQMISWLVVQPDARTGATLRSFIGETPKEANGVPWGLRLDPSLPMKTLEDQIATMQAMGGKVVVLPAVALAQSPSTWRALWTGSATPRPADAPIPKKVYRTRKAR